KQEMLLQSHLGQHISATLRCNTNTSIEYQPHFLSPEVLVSTYGYSPWKDIQTTREELSHDSSCLVVWNCPATPPTSWGRRPKEGIVANVKDLNVGQRIMISMKFPIGHRYYRYRGKYFVVVKISSDRLAYAEDLPRRSIRISIVDGDFTKV